MNPRISDSALLPRALTILLAAAAATITVAGLRGVSHIAAPVLLALILTIAVHPVRIWVVAKGLPSWLATLLMILCGWGIVIALLLMVGVAAARLATELPKYYDEADARAESATEWLDSFGVAPEQRRAVSEGLDLSKLTDVLADLLGGVLGVVSGMALLLGLLLFMTIDAAVMPRLLANAWVERASAVDALRVFADGTRSYLLVSTVFGLIVAAIDTVLLWALGVPLAVLWGLLAFVTNYIPNIGFVIGLVPPALLALLEGGPGLMLAVIALYSVVNLVIQSVIQPKVVGDKVGLSSTITFVSLVFWVWVLGPLGAILAVPMSILVRSVFIDVDPRAQWVRPLIAADDSAPRKSGGTRPAHEVGD